MGFVFPTSEMLEFELNGVGGGWTDVTVDMTDEDTILDYGIKSSQPTMRVAGTGILSFGLRNDARNSGSTVGYYSPFNSARRTGFGFGIRVRHTITYGGTTYRWLGRLGSIDAMPDQYGDRVVHCQAFDWMDEAARTIVQVSLGQNQRADQAFSALVGCVTLAPETQSIDVSADTYRFASDNLPNGTKVLTALAVLARSEVGYIGQRRNTTTGQTVFFEARRTRSVTSSIRATLSETMDVLNIDPSRDAITTRLRVTVHPRSTATGLVIATIASGSRGLVNPGESQTWWLDYTDPTQRSVKIGGVNQIAPVAVTDYTMNSAVDGSGTDLTAHFSVVATFFAATAKVVVTNNGTSAGYITTLQIRGDGIYAINPVQVEASIAANVATYGDNLAEMDLTYQEDPVFANNAAQYLARLYGQPFAGIREVSFLANQSDALMTAALAGDISDKVQLAETVSGLSTAGSFYINAVRLKVSQTGMVQCTWGLTPADLSTYWQVGKSGASELGVTTYLGF